MKRLTLVEDENRTLRTELARLRGVLADAWVLNPLVWVAVHGEHGGFRTQCGKYEVWTKPDAGGLWYWMSDLHHVTQLCDSLADGQRKAESWHFERATAPFTKVVTS